MSAAGCARFLNFMPTSIALAFRAEFDETMFRREINAVLGLTQAALFLDLALILLVLEQAQRSGMHAVRELLEMEKAQRWSGKRR